MERDAMIDCAVCGWRHTVPCGRDECPHDAATHYATIAGALDNAVKNGCAEELSKMSDEDIAYDLARLDAACERLPIEMIRAGVEAWRAPQKRKHRLPSRIEEEIQELEWWFAKLPVQQAGPPRFRGLRDAVLAAIEKRDAALDAAWQDIKDWMRFGIELRAKVPKPDFSALTPTEAGIEKSDRVLKQITEAGRGD